MSWRGALRWWHDHHHEDFLKSELTKTWEALALLISWRCSFDWTWMSFGATHGYTDFFRPVWKKGHTPPLFLIFQGAILSGLRTGKPPFDGHNFIMIVIQLNGPPWFHSRLSSNRAVSSEGIQYNLQRNMMQRTEDIFHGYTYLHSPLTTPKKSWAPQNIVLLLWNIREPIDTDEWGYSWFNSCLVRDNSCTVLRRGWSSWPQRPSWGLEFPWFWWQKKPCFFSSW